MAGALLCSASGPVIAATAPRITRLGPPLPPAGDLVGAIELAVARGGPRAGDVVALDRATGRLTQTTADGAIVRVWGSRGTRDGQFAEPVDLASDAGGGLWVADAGRGTLERFDAVGRFAGRVSLPGDAPSQVVALPGPAGGPVVLAGRALISVAPDGEVGDAIRLGFEPLAIDALPGGDLVAVAAEARGPIVRILAPDGRIRASWPLDAGDRPVLRPADVAAAPDGTLLVADADRDRIVRFTAEGEALASWGGQGYGGGTFEPGCCFGPSSIAVAAGGTVYAADDGLGLVQRFDPDGAFVAEWGGSGRQPGRFNRPSDVAFAVDGDLIVMDSDNYRVQRVAPDGTPRWAVGHFGDGPAEFGADVDSRYPSQRGPTSLAVGPRRAGGAGALHPGARDVDDIAASSVDETGEVVVVLDVWNRRIQRLDAADGAFLGAFDVPLAVPGTRDVHAVVAIGPRAAANAGAIYLLAPESGRVTRYADDGAIEGAWSLEDAFDAPGHPRAMAMGPDGTAWLWAGASLAGISPEGAPLRERRVPAMEGWADGTEGYCAEADAARLAVVVALEGPLRAYLSLPDCSELVLLEFSASSGELLRSAGLPFTLIGLGLGRPMGMAVNATDGLWFADAADDRIRRARVDLFNVLPQTLGASQPAGARDLSAGRGIAGGTSTWLARSDAVSDAAVLDAWDERGAWRWRGRYRCVPFDRLAPGRPIVHGIGPEVRIAEASSQSLLMSIIDPSGPSCVALVYDDTEVAPLFALTETARIVAVAGLQVDPPLPPQRIWLARDGLPVMVFEGMSKARLPDLPLVADALAALPTGGLVAVLDGGDEIAIAAPDGTVQARWPSPDRAFVPHVAAGPDGAIYTGAGPTVQVRDAAGTLVDTWTLDAPVRGLAAGEDGRVLALLGRVLPETLVRLDGSYGSDATDGTTGEPARALRIDRAVRHAGRWLAEWPTGGPEADPGGAEEAPPGDGEAPAERRLRFSCPPNPLDAGCSAVVEGALRGGAGDVVAVAVGGGARLWLGERLVVDAWDAEAVVRRVPLAGGGEASGGAAWVPMRLEVNRADETPIVVRLGVAAGAVYLPVAGR